MKQSKQGIYARYIKRILDVILSGCALVVLSPVMLATAIAIVVDDPSAGPIFSQERIGRDGKPFRFYKFRSMCEDAERDGPPWADADDARCTHFGAFLRRTRLDELPQIWDIFVGDSGIIGTTKKNLDFTRVSLA